VEVGELAGVAEVVVGAAEEEVVEEAAAAAGKRFRST
jgi:hypothetical protein